MLKTGLLILTRPASAIYKDFNKILSHATKIVSSTLYVHIQPISPNEVNSTKRHFQIKAVPPDSEIQKLVSKLYFQSAGLCNGLDIRIFLGHLTNNHGPTPPFPLKNGYQVILVDQPQWVSESYDCRAEIISNVKASFPTAGEPRLEVMELDTYEPESTPSVVSHHGPSAPLQTYDNVILGGTFDRLHMGHKLILSQACLLANRRLVVGVTAENMHTKKVLHELIEDIAKRKGNVLNFLEDVKPGLKFEVVPIHDVNGPTDYDPDLQCLVLSQETIKGGPMINSLRKDKGLSVLAEYVVDLISDECHSQFEEEKISSSSLRKRALGTLINPVEPKPNLPTRPYLIGLCGGIGSGKSSICQRLEKLGAGTVDCDKLGHQVYVKGAHGYDKIVEEFGQDILGVDGEIDRKVLGAVVFNDKGKLQRLNHIVWPEVQKLALQQAEKLHQEGKDVIVLEAALLLEAGWKEKLHEVWTVVVPEGEAVTRIMERNKLSREEASKRVNNQMSNVERVSLSNVVLCALWEYDYTQTQVERAWTLLKKRMAL
ncbi:hypothetical protein ScPMuIL_015578 [Solemya velum]